MQANSSIDLFSPELEKERQKRSADPVTTDLLGALLAVSAIISSAMLIVSSGYYLTYVVLSF